MSATLSGIESLDARNGAGYVSRMDISEFALKEAKRGGWKSVDEFRQYHEITPCDCGKKKCKGWQVRWKWGAERRREAGRPRARRTPSTVPGFIYFARLGDLIKIGFSQDPATRVRSLNADPLAICEGTRELEAELHDEFGDLRESGEWFRAEPRLLERIEALTK